MFERNAIQLSTVLAGLLVAGCGETRGSDDPFASGTAAGGIPGTGGVDDGGGDATGGDAADGASDDDEGGGGGVKLDVAGGAGDGTPGCVGEECMGCTSVDLLFVIDNSGSMGDYQGALALAFVDFADTLDAALPMGTNVHVGVTSTEMGYSSMGQTNSFNGACTFLGDGDQPNDAFYVTAADSDSGRNGAQGRLYEPAAGGAYYDYDVGTGGAALQGFKDWFGSAATIGEGGSNIEMSAAPVGWFADPANAGTNAGFLRDEGSVLVVFFLQDEPDQTPTTIDGMSGGQFVLSQVAAAKTGCGGLDCVITGGFMATGACAADGDLPLDEFIAGVGQPPVVAQLPDENLAEDFPAQAAAEMNALLSETLADVIAQTCDEIAPVG
jgi:hypothetical protein